MTDGKQLVTKENIKEFRDKLKTKLRWSGTRAEYTALTAKDAYTTYYITDECALIRDDVEYMGGSRICDMDLTYDASTSKLGGTVELTSEDIADMMKGRVILRMKVDGSTRTGDQYLMATDFSFDGTSAFCFMAVTPDYDLSSSVDTEAARFRAVKDTGNNWTVTGQYGSGDSYKALAATVTYDSATEAWSGEVRDPSNRMSASEMFSSIGLGEAAVRCTYDSKTSIVFTGFSYRTTASDKAQGRCYGIDMLDTTKRALYTATVTYDALLLKTKISFIKTGDALPTTGGTVTGDILLDGASVKGGASGSEGASIALNGTDAPTEADKGMFSISAANGSVEKKLVGRPADAGLTWDGSVVLTRSDIKDGCETEEEDPVKSVLSAHQGKVLKDLIDNITLSGRFVTLWDCSTGTPSGTISNPFVYQGGDFYIVGKVANEEGAKNYRPDGTQWAGAASTVEEGSNVEINDVYRFSSSNTWELLHLSEKEVSFKGLTGEPTDNINLAAALNNKSKVEVSDTGEATATASYITIDGNKKYKLSAIDDTKLPLLGGTMSGTVMFKSTVDPVISSEADKGFLHICGGKTAGQGSNIYLRGSEHSDRPGSIFLIVHKKEKDSEGETQDIYHEVDIKPGTLADGGVFTYDNHNVVCEELPIKNSLVVNKNVMLVKCKDEDGFVTMLGGNTNGAYLTLHGKDRSDGKGDFYLAAANDTNSKCLVGKADGTLTWGLRTGGQAVITADKIVDNLTSSDAGKPLSANQGKVLANKFTSYLPKDGGLLTGPLYMADTTPFILLYMSESTGHYLANDTNDPNNTYTRGGMEYTAGTGEGKTLKVWSSRSDHTPGPKLILSEDGTFTLISTKSTSSSDAYKLIGGADGKLTWNGSKVATSDALYDGTLGNANRPIYFKNGKPTACNTISLVNVTVTCDDLASGCSFTAQKMQIGYVVQYMIYFTGSNAQNGQLCSNFKLDGKLLSELSSHHVTINLINTTDSSRWAFMNFATDGAVWLNTYNSWGFTGNGTGIFFKDK